MVTFATTPSLLVAGSIPTVPVPAISEIDYQLTFTRATATTRSLGVSMRFQAAAARPIELSRQDIDTWRLHVPAAGQVTVSFDFTADTLDNAMAWSRSDFSFVNGTNVLLYPEGAGVEGNSATGYGKGCPRRRRTVQERGRFRPPLAMTGWVGRAVSGWDGDLTRTPLVCRVRRAAP